MAKSFKATWLGDEDPGAQIIRMGDLRFIKGEPTDVPEDHAMAETLRSNPMFAIDDAKANVVQADEPTDDEQSANADRGTERGELKAQLRALGVDVKGNPSVETLRQKLADATA